MAPNGASGTSPSAVFAPAPPAPTTAAVKRPDPGLARGVWEAPRWTFFVAIAVIVVLALGYALARAGVLRRLRARRDAR